MCMCVYMQGRSSTILRGKRKYTLFERIYFTLFIKLSFEVVHKLLVLKVQQNGIENYLLKQLATCTERKCLFYTFSTYSKIDSIGLL